MRAIHKPWLTREGEQALCEEVPAAAALFARASEQLGYDLLAVCTSGPKEKLDMTAVRARGQIWFFRRHASDS